MERQQHESTSTNNSKGEDTMKEKTKTKAA
jgi:hypothetical protein